MKKLLSVIYGLISYAVFLVAFLYAIGFVGNLVVPKTIDSGGGDLTLSSVIINALLLMLFALQHSIMARPAFKQKWTTFIHPAIERSTYVLLSSLVLLLLYWQWHPISAIIWKTEGIAATILTVFYFIGWLIVLLSTFMINHFDLFGLKQVFDNFKNNQLSSSRFQVNMLYKIVRHPIMLGFLIAFWAAPVMTVGHLLFTLATTGYILIAVKCFEEKDLIKTFGKEYEEYKKKVPMLIPFTGSKN